MAEIFTLKITSGADGIQYRIESESPVSICGLVGALEICKMKAFEDMTPHSASTPRGVRGVCGVCGAEQSAVEKRRALIGMARKVCLADEPLPVRAVNALAVYGIVTLEDLLRYTRRVLREFRNLGRKTLDDVCRYVERRGCEFGSLAPIWYERRGALALSDLSRFREFDTREEALDWMVRENDRIRKEEEGL